MFPLPVRMMMKIKTMTPAVQRMTSWMMSWLMHGEDAKIEAGKVLREINEVWLKLNLAVLPPLYLLSCFRVAYLEDKPA